MSMDQSSMHLAELNLSQEQDPNRSSLLNQT